MARRSVPPLAPLSLVGHPDEAAHGAKASAPAAVAPPERPLQLGALAIRARPAVGPWFSPCEHASAEVIENADRKLALYGTPTAARISELRDDVIARLSRMRESAVVLDRTSSEAARRELVADCQKVMDKAPLVGTLVVEAAETSG